MKDKYDLEQEIANLYNIVDDLHNIKFGIENDRETREELISILNGLMVLYRFKIDKLHHTFEEVCFCKDSEALTSDFI